MDIRTSNKAVKLLSRIFDHRVSTETMIPYSPQKSAWPENPEFSQSFERVTPESQGVDSAYLTAFLRELEAETTLDMHDIMILRNGKVISEGWFGPRKKDVWHITYSMSKSITGLAVGMLIDDGKLKLDDRLVDIFAMRASILKLIKGGFTVRHLMTMSTGVAFNEAGSVTEEDWREAFFESIPKFEVGTKFNYNSMNSYMLSCVVKEISGKDLDEFLDDRLWKPLGIGPHYWEKSPTGVSKGGWGLYIRPEDAAKIGQMVLDGGVWNGQRIISEAYLKEASTAHMTAPESYGDFNYGYQLWVGREQNSFLFNGMFGQNVIGFFDTGILIASNAGNDELFQQSAFFTLLKKYFGPNYVPGDTLPENSTALNTLRETEATLYPDRKSVEYKLFKRLALKKQIASLDGKKWWFDRSEASSFGLLPLYTQALQNNHTKGLVSLSFAADKYVLYMHFDEADEGHRIAIGFTQPEYSTITSHREPYIVSALGKFGFNESDELVLTIDISFIETAGDRTIKLLFRADGTVVVSMTERPGKQYLYSGLEVFIGAAGKSRLISQLSAKADPDYLHYKLKSVMEPTVTGTPS